MPVSRSRVSPYWRSDDGRFEIYCGNCSDILPLIKVGSIIADPPYNIGLGYNLYEDNMPVDDYWNWLRSVVNICCASSNNMVFFKHHASKIIEWGKEIGIGRMLVWYKPYSLSSSRDNGLYNHFEPIWLVKGKTPAHLKDVITCNAGAGNTEESTGHPAQMPEKMTQELVGLCTNDSVICDPFMGSGTTGVVSVRMGLKFVGIELDQHYCDMSIGRIKLAMRTEGTPPPPRKLRGH